VIIAVSAFAVIATWTVSAHRAWRANEDFAAAVLASASPDTPLHRDFLPPSELASLESQSYQLTGEPRRVLADEAWGALEFGYCVASGAYVYITFLSKPAPPKPARLTIYEAGSPWSRVCASP
jgi:hypothetical protein